MRNTLDVSIVSYSFMVFQICFTSVYITSDTEWSTRNLLAFTFPNDGLRQAILVAECNVHRAKPPASEQ